MIFNVGRSGLTRAYSTGRIYWRDGTTLQDDLFLARHSNLIVATDALAVRVLQAGITDVAFYDQQRMLYLYDRGERRSLIVKTL